ncbi:MAG TPA: biotin/lipoate A/B protein ligase family protein [Anaerolineales bacterium]|nr:biotin/lipoate A/B protein ligase family protein [Anaerolineales bacterium]
MSPQHAHWRLIVSPPADGPANMAMDEAILESVTAGAEQPTLRLYAWDPACLSIGYAQLLAEADEGRLAERGWSLVRRPTGGRAILHTDELTYAIIAPSTDPHVEGGVLASYRRLSEGLLLGLRRLGLEPRVRDAAPLPLEERADPVCFEVPSAYEITAGGRKLIGSAQLRRQGGVLQHGSLPLSGDIGRICLGLRFPDEAARQSRVERLRSKASTVEELLGRTVAWEEAAGALRDGFAESLGLKFDEGELSRVEADRTDQLVRERYAHPEWTGRV